MRKDNHRTINWLDVVWLLFLGGLAVLPPLWNIRKELTLLAIGVVQVVEGRLIEHIPRRGRSYAVLLKLVFSTLLIASTGGPSINSSYYPIYYLPVVTAAIYFGLPMTLFWTLLASGLYCSFLYPALEEYELTADAITELVLRVVFFFVAALVVNRFAVENRLQTSRYQQLAEQLAETNRQLQTAQAEARRSERLAALGQLSAGLAHEIRNPLGVIRGSAEMLNKKLEASNPIASELAGYISGEVDRVSIMVGRFLDFARPLHAETSPQSVTELLERALKSVAEQWHGGKIEVERGYQDDLPLAQLDENLCEQALVNLIQNAYEAMGNDGGTLRASVSKASRDNRPGVEIRLEDTGPGVPPELREQIFNPFVTTKKTGTGLGLSIVSKILDEHRGSISVDSGPNRGACFIVFLPTAEQAVQKEGALASG